MSYLKDAKIIKTIAESSNCSELSEDACRYILANTELMLRRVIKDTLKYKQKFNRTKVKSEDLDIVLNDLNLSFLLFGLSKPVANVYVKADKVNLELDKQDLCIKESMRLIIATRLLKKKKIEINFDWLSVEGKLNPLIETVSTVDSLVFNSIDRSRQNGLQVTPFNDAQKCVDRTDNINYDYLTGKNNKNVFLVKELNPNVLTKEASLFFETFRKILEEYFQLVDQKFAKIDNGKFFYGSLSSFVGNQNQL